MIQIHGGTVAKLAMLKFVSSALIFGQGFFGHKVACASLDNFAKYEAAGQNPGMYEKMTEHVQQLKKKTKYLILAQFILTILSFVAIHMISNRMIHDVVRQE